MKIFWDFIEFAIALSKTYRTLKRSFFLFYVCFQFVLIYFNFYNVMKLKKRLIRTKYSLSMENRAPLRGSLHIKRLLWSIRIYFLFFVIKIKLLLLHCLDVCVCVWGGYTGRELDVYIHILYYTWRRGWKHTQLLLYTYNTQRNIRAYMYSIYVFRYKYKIHEVDTRRDPLDNELSYTQLHNIIMK